MNDLEQKIFSIAKKQGGLISYGKYIDMCLYDYQHGYYTKNKVRVGDNGDFYTSVSLKQNLFGKLIKASAKHILQKYNKDISAYKILEIGAEPQKTMIENADVVRIGQPLSLSDNIVVVSNELIDARPFERFKFQNGTWQKCMIAFADSFHQRNELLKNPSEYELEILEKYFPKAKVENFRLDISFDAIDLFDNICSQNWNGLLIFADYFRFASELELLPHGTARTYFKHTQGDNLFSNIGDTDITYSPCSNVFEDIAKKYNFSTTTHTQEQFIVKFASEEAEKIVSTPDTTDLQKRELCQLISPVHMGSCFRILSAIRL